MSGGKNCPEHKYSLVFFQEESEQQGCFIFKKKERPSMCQRLLGISSPVISAPVIHAPVIHEPVISAPEHSNSAPILSTMKAVPPQCRCISNVFNIKAELRE